MYIYVVGGGGGTSIIWTGSCTSFGETRVREFYCRFFLKYNNIMNHT